MLRDFRQRSNVTSMLQYLKWEPLAERRTKARLIIIYRIIKGKTEIPTDTADLQPGRCGHFIQHTHHYQQYKTVFIHGQSVIETHLGETSIHQIQIQVRQPGV